MNLKLTNKQFFKLYDLLEETVLRIRPTGISGHLYHSVLIGVYKKFYSKAFYRDLKKYSVNLTDEEACAWYLFFSSIEIPVDADKHEQVFKTSLLQTINLNIHQKFSV
jgi:hypothetical protein